MTTLPIFTYRGNVTELPRDANMGDIVLESRSNEVYVYTGARWEYCYPTFTFTKRKLVEDLYEFLQKYEECDLKSSILDLMEIYRLKCYE